MSESARVFSDEWAIEKRLNEVFDAKREDFMPIIREVVGAMADAVEDDPIFAKGMFGHIHGVRNTRGLFRAKGWKLLRKNGNELVEHPDRPLMVGYQTVDIASVEDRDPKAISGKGSGAKQVIDEAQLDFFDKLEMRLDQLPAPSDTGLWHLCVSVEEVSLDEVDVRAEISFSKGVENGNFSGFIERIFLLQKGEWSRVDLKKDEPLDAVEFKPVVKRKK